MLSVLARRGNDMLLSLIKALGNSDGRLASAIRGLIRAITLAITAFIAKMDPEQIGAISLLLEAVLQVLVSAVPNPDGGTPKNEGATPPDVGAGDQ
jgi:hypothetical protein